MLMESQGKFPQVRKTFLAIHSKTAMQYSPKQMK